jgi:hypothetical protein
VATLPSTMEATGVRRTLLLPALKSVQQSQAKIAEQRY